jgi:hypothetical protein
MDDKSIYGNIIYAVKLENAIQDKVLTDYTIVTSDYNSELDNNVDEYNLRFEFGNEIIMSAILLIKCIKELGLKKIFTYHGTINESVKFSILMQKLALINELNIKTFSLDGNITVKKRYNIISEFEKSNIAILSSAKVLGEGIDLKSVDSVVFVSFKSSYIDITQCLGRCLRKFEGKNMSHVIVPLFSNNKTRNEQKLNYIVAAIKTEDERIVKITDNKINNNLKCIGLQLSNVDFVENKQNPEISIKKLNLNDMQQDVHKHTHISNIKIKSVSCFCDMTFTNMVDYLDHMSGCNAVKNVEENSIDTYYMTHKKRHRASNNKFVYIKMSNVLKIHKFVKIDKPVLSYIINNFDEVVKQIKRDTQKVYMNSVLEFLKEIKNKLTTNNYYDETYKRTRDVGRFFTYFNDEKCKSFQGLMREIRNEIFRLDYVDMDFVNTQPTILMQYCNKNKIPQLAISDYVNNRETWFTELSKYYGKDKTYVKDLINKISNGCESVTKDIKLHQKLKEYKQNIDNIIDFMLENEKDEKRFLQMKKKKDGKPVFLRGSIISNISQQIECNALMALEEWLKTNFNTEIFVFMFDGGYVLKDFKDKISEKLNDLESFIFEKTTYKLKVIFKEMPKEINIPVTVYDDFNDNETYKQLKFKFETEMKVCKILQPLGYAYFDNNGQYHFMSQKQLIEHFQDFSIYRGKEYALVKSTFVQNWILDPQKKIYDRVDFLPPPLECPPNILNKFTGFEQEKRQKKYEKINGKKMPTSKKALKMILELVERIAGDKKNANYFHTWFAQIVQQPGKLSRIYILCRSHEHGIGKMQFYRFFSNIIGSNYTFTGTCKKGIFDGFNSIIEDKLFVNIDEITTDFMNTYQDELKILVANTESSVRRLFTETYKIKSFVRWWLVSNREVEPFLEAASRRDVFMESFANKMDAFEQEQYEILINDQIAMNTYYQYLKSIDLQYFNFEDERPITNYYLRCIARHKCPSYEFLQALLCDTLPDLKLTDNQALDNKNLSTFDADKNPKYKISCALLYKTYLNYCHTNHFRNNIIHIKTFESNLQQTQTFIKKASGGYHFWFFSCPPVIQYLKNKKLWTENITFLDHDQNINLDQKHIDSRLIKNFEDLHDGESDPEENGTTQKFKKHPDNI